MNDTKRLLSIVGQMSADGAETYLMKLFRNMDPKKYVMDFCVTIKEEGYYDREIYQLNGRIFHIPPKTKAFWKNFFGVYSVVKKNNYKYVLRVSQHSLSAFELLAAKIAGAKITAYRASNSNTCGGKLNTLLHYAFRWMPRYFADVKFAPSTESGIFMFGEKSVKEGKVVILPNALNYKEYAFTLEKRLRIRSEFSIEDDCVLYGHVGRFTEQKNHKFIIDVFSDVKKSTEKAKLMLVGKGELEDDIHKYVIDKGLCGDVIFTGVRSDVKDIYSAFDLLLFPSLYEGMPNVIIEAQAAGLKCIVSDTITKEADITGLVRFLTINSTEEWVKKIVALKNYDHVDTFKDFVSHGYDISNVSEIFIKRMFYNDK